MKPYDEFRRAIRVRESSDRYACVNKLGYLGAYQFGMARLCDLGLTRRKDPKSKSFGNSAFEFIEQDGRAKFLASPVLQDKCFDLHVKMLRHELKSWFRGDNLSGAIAVCHLLGAGGLRNWVTKGIDGADGFGTRGSEYFARFEGYEIPW